MHGPVLAAGPETTLTGVWARRPEAATATAAALGTVAVDSFEDLLADCEAVAFAVPPDVQAELAVRAASAGKALLLEKPLALDLAGARRLVAAVRDAKVVSEVVFSKRFHPRIGQFLTDCGQLSVAGPLWGMDARYWHGGLLDGPFAHGWRLQHGALTDLGPHLIDLVDAVLGPVTAVRAAGDPLTYVALSCRHGSGALSQLSLSGSVRMPAAHTVLEVAGRAGRVTLDTAAMDHSECWPVLRRDFATAIRTGSPVLCGIERGLMVAQVLESARRSLLAGGTDVAVTG
jgi:predicted dehydrogenase